MSELLALGSALAFGAGDFMGGLASRSAPPLRITAIAQVASVAALMPLLLLVPASNATFADVAWGAAGGLFGLLGLLGLFTALGSGPMGVVAPTTAVVSAVVPVTFGLVTGERPGGFAMVGIVLGVLAVLAVTLSDSPAGSPDRRVVVLALGAGLGFGLFFIFLAQTGVESGMWPLVGARAISVPVILALAFTAARQATVGVHGRRLALGSGVLDMLANAMFLAAAQRGLLAVAAVLSALYPAATVVLARVVLKERMSFTQLAGVGAAVVAVVLIGVPA